MVQPVSRPLTEAELKALSSEDFVRIKAVLYDMQPFWHLPFSEAARIYIAGKKAQETK